MNAVRDMPPACAASGNTGAKRAGIRPRAHIAIVLAAALLMLLTGCATGGTTAPGSASASPTSAKATLCQRIGDINQTLTQLATIGDNTTIGEVKALQQKLSKALDALGKVPVGSGDALSNLQAANDQLAAAIKDLPDSATVGEVGPRLQVFKDNVSKAQAAATKLSSTLRC